MDTVGSKNARVQFDEMVDERLRRAEELRVARLTWRPSALFARRKR